MMPTRPPIAGASLGVICALLVAVAAQAPPIANAQLTRQPGAQLASTFDSLLKVQTGARWIGYNVPAVRGERGTMVSGDAECCTSCRLERSSGRRAQTPPEGRTAAIRLEPSDEMAVLFRAVGNRVERVRIFPAHCELDAGGLPVVWLDDVRPPDSIALLESLTAAEGDAGSRVRDGAISAIALHADSAADASLERLTSASRSPSVRKKVAFWLGQARGARGLERLRQLLRDDPSLDVRKSAVFGVAQSTAPGALDELIATARSHSEPAVRAQAIFWLGQKAGRKAAEAITERIAQDPDTEVKKRAVFALSQLPKDEGVPLLIKVARTNSNLAVRKQAMFWLGQSRDPRAIDFFSEILK